VSVSLGQDALVKEIFDISVLFSWKNKGYNNSNYYRQALIFLKIVMLVDTPTYLFFNFLIDIQVKWIIEKEDNTFILYVINMHYIYALEKKCKIQFIISIKGT